MVSSDSPKSGRMELFHSLRRSESSEYCSITAPSLGADDDSVSPDSWGHPQIVDTVRLGGLFLDCCG